MIDSLTFSISKRGKEFTAECCEVRAEVSSEVRGRDAEDYGSRALALEARAFQVDRY